MYLPFFISWFSNVGEPLILIKSPLELNRKLTLPMYFVFAYACRIGTSFLAFCTCNGYGPYGFSMLGWEPEQII